MRRYDDPVEVRRGMVDDGGEGRDSIDGAPEQFLWKGRLWKVRAVQAHWVETGPWWQSPGVHALLGQSSDNTAGAESSESSASSSTAVHTDLLAEREVWRVEAGRGGPRVGHGPLGGGVFDLVFDWSDGTWRLARCVD
jgi:hypothetical protein